MTQLSEHFSLAELTRTDTGLPNTPGQGALDNLSIAAEGMEKVRAFLGGKSIRVDSGYRGPEVNKAVRGVTTSAHCLGYAVDFDCPAFGSPYDVAKALAGSGIEFDQLIREYGWVHVSFDPKKRGECLTKRSAASPYERGIQP